MRTIWNDPDRAKERRQIIELIGLFALTLTSIISITTIGRIREQRQQREAKPTYCGIKIHHSVALVGT